MRCLVFLIDSRESTENSSHEKDHSRDGKVATEITGRFYWECVAKFSSPPRTNEVLILRLSGQKYRMGQQLDRSLQLLTLFPELQTP